MSNTQIENEILKIHYIVFFRFCIFCSLSILTQNATIAIAIQYIVLVGAVATIPTLQFGALNMVEIEAFNNHSICPSKCA